MRQLSELLLTMHSMLRKSTLAQNEQIDSIHESQYIIESVLHITREKQLSYPELDIEAHACAQALEACQKRASGTPIAYVLGHSYFYGHKFKVNEDVLIPRTETEFLVDLCLDITRNTKLSSQIARCILDCGTGSGCIGISLAAELDRSWKIAMSDIQDKALNLARTNTERILGKANTVHLYKDSFLDKLIQNEYQAGIIVANLPYLCLDQISFSNISEEPLSALSDKSLYGMAGITSLLNQASQLAYPHIVLLEFDPLQLDSIIRLLASSTYTQFQEHRDLRGIVRFVSCRNFS